LVPDTSVATKLSKLFSLPDSEMDRGPKHAEKAGAGSSIYELLRSKIDQGQIIVSGGAPKTLLASLILS
jgi:hypothetical protein